MFFYISKILGYLLNPLGWIIIFMIIGMISKRSARKKRMLLISFAMLVLFTNPFLGDEAINLWEVPLKSLSELPRKQPASNIKQLGPLFKSNGQLLPSNSKIPSYPAGVLLCGDIASYDKQTDRIIFKTGADRLMQTIDLYQKGIIGKIVISGGSGHLIYRDRTEASFIKKYLVGIGIDPEDIIFESRSKNTYENAKFTKELLVENKINDTVILITSALHMKRAQAVFKKQGIKVIAYPTSKITGIRLTNADHLLIPSVMTLINWNLLIHELIGCAVYKVSGYC